ncbi:cellulase family glycosylhydrolase [Candidatus Saccharibacteria bacterium]|nr:cellulase family glycosylhydrolase [Candidatus Saccharibacteria bacterium]
MQATRWIGATTSGAPASGAYLVGDFVINQDGHIFICTAAGTPGTWVEAGDGTYQPADQALTTKWVGVGHNAALDTVPNWKVRGVNISKVGSSSGITWWTTDYDWAGKIQPAIAGAVAIGCNTIRVNGSYQAYATDPPTYKTRFNQILNYSKSLGLRMIYSFINGNWDTPVSSSRAAYNTMMVDLLTAWVGDSSILAWEYGNELDAGGSADLLTLVTNLHTDLRAFDATTKLTGGGAAEPTTANIIAYNSLVDFHDLHFYPRPSNTKLLGINPLDIYKSLTTKPILIGEFGANIGSGLLNVGDEHAVANYYRRFREIAATSSCMGAIAWQYMDDDSTNQFGLYSLAGVPRQALAEFMQFPDRSDEAAGDAVRYRGSPVVLDNFARVTSATTVGTSPLGGSPTAALGTWGIKSVAFAESTHQVAYLVTGDVSTDNFLLWEANTGDVDIDLEFNPNQTYHNTGIIARYADVNNFLYLQYRSNVLNLVSRVNGFDTQVVGSLGGKMLDQGRIRMSLRGNQVLCYQFDRCVYQTTPTVPMAMNTKHGIRVKSGTVNPGDGGSTFRRIAITIPVRSL